MNDQVTEVFFALRGEFPAPDFLVAEVHGTFYITDLDTCVSARVILTPENNGAIVYQANVIPSPQESVKLEGIPAAVKRLFLRLRRESKAFTDRAEYLKKSQPE